MIALNMRRENKRRTKIFKTHGKIYVREIKNVLPKLLVIYYRASNTE